MALLAAVCLAAVLGSTAAAAAYVPENHVNGQCVCVFGSLAACLWGLGTRMWSLGKCGRAGLPPAPKPVECRAVLPTPSCLCRHTDCGVVSLCVSVCS